MNVIDYVFLGVGLLTLGLMLLASKVTRSQLPPATGMQPRSPAGAR